MNLEKSKSYRRSLLVFAYQNLCRTQHEKHWSATLLDLFVELSVEAYILGFRQLLQLVVKKKSWLWFCCTISWMLFGVSYTNVFSAFKFLLPLISNFLLFWRFFFMSFCFYTFIVSSLTIIVNDKLRRISQYDFGNNYNKRTWTNWKSTMMIFCVFTPTLLYLISIECGGVGRGYKKEVENVSIGIVLAYILLVRRRVWMVKCTNTQ